jgi:hypothetical protein
MYGYCLTLHHIFRFMHLLLITTFCRQIIQILRSQPGHYVSTTKTLQNVFQYSFAHLESQSIVTIVHNLLEQHFFGRASIMVLHAMCFNLLRNATRVSRIPHAKSSVKTCVRASVSDCCVNTSQFQVYYP